MRTMRRMTAAEPIAMPTIMGVPRGDDDAWGGDWETEVPDFKMSTILAFPRGFAGWTA